jgi:hypothetical protein
MKSTYWIAVIAALVFCVVISPADAAKKSTARKNTARSNLASIRLECFKQYGAWYDASTKRWVMHGTIYTLPGRIDAVHNCVAQRTGTRPVPFLREERAYR